ncbi:MAG: histidinol-phosphatase [Candidatus Pacearchaeota archaeon]|nr:histidinol-phosphatase [Candidatus Pacearchaeota archaeon]
MAFTEHVNKNTDWFDDFKKRIDALKNNKHIKIFFGIEAGTVDFNGTLNATQEIIRKSDIVLGVVHRYPNGRGGLIALNETKDLGQDKAAEVEFKLALALINNKNVDVLGHPFGVYSKFFNRFPEGYMKELLIESLKKDKSVEINTKYIFEKDRFFKLLKEINPYVSIGSDAHSREEIARSFDMIRKVVKK